MLTIVLIASLQRYVNFNLQTSTKYNRNTFIILIEALERVKNILDLNKYPAYFCNQKYKK